MNEALSDEKKLSGQVLTAAEELFSVPEIGISAWTAYQNDRRFGQALAYLAAKPFCYPPFVSREGDSVIRLALKAGGWYSAVMKPEKIKLSIRVLVATAEIYELAPFLVFSNKGKALGIERHFNLLMRDFWLVPIKDGFSSGLLRLPLRVVDSQDMSFSEARCCSQHLAEQASRIKWSFSKYSPTSENLVIMATGVIACSLKESAEFVRVDFTVFKPPKPEEYSK